MRKVSPTYKSWNMMLQRCENPNYDKYQYYGGRGIKVCERWRLFVYFQADMGDRPPGTTLDRINNDGNYEPGNCRWVSRQEQSNNTRANRLLTFGGRTLNATQWAREFGISPKTIDKRLRLHWSMEEIAQGRRWTKTTCVNGHPITPDSFYISRNRNGETHACKLCHAATVARYQARVRARRA